MATALSTLTSAINLDGWSRLETFTLLILVAIGLGLGFLYDVTILQQRRLKVSRTRFSRTLPLVKWTGIQLFVLDGFISLINLRKRGVNLLEEVTAKYGSVFRVALPFTEVIAVSDLNIIQKLLNSPNAGHLNKHKYFYGVALTGTLKDGLVVLDADLWSPHRKAIAPAFSYNSFPTYLKYTQDEAVQLAKFALLAASKTSQKTLDNTQMRELIYQHALKITTHVIMGSESFTITEEDRSNFHKSFRRGKSIAADRILHPELMIPPIWFLHPKKRELDQIMEEGFQLTNKITNHYRMKESCKTLLEDENYSPQDELETYSQNVYVENNVTHENVGAKPFECLVEKMIKAGLSNKEICDEVGTFLATGHETVVTALDFLIFHLAGNKGPQEKCHLEVDEFFNSKHENEDALLSMEDLTRFKYLERCILESLRLTPTVPMFIRRLDAPLEIKDGCTFEAGENLMIMPWIVHRNPEIYPNPKVFDPDRFLPENVKTRHSHSFIPFSLGMRNCIGWKVALLEMKVIMAWILRNFEMTTTDELDDAKILFDVTVKTERPFNVTFKKRTHRIN